MNYEFGLTEGQARSELARLNLFAQVVEKPIKDLSGGEKTRVALTKLILTGANFLILDEPTNHLDLAAREAIEAALQDFDGTILIVTHDRYLLDKVTTRTIELAMRNAQCVMRNEKSKPENLKLKAQSSKLKANAQAIDKVEAQLKMAEMELKMIEHEINAAVEPEKLSELAQAHEAKLKEIDELYLRFDELYLRREELGNNAKCEMRNAQ